MIFGANILAAIVAIGRTAILTIPFYLIIKRCCLRVTKVEEIIGLDVTQHLLGHSKLQSHIEGVITEYYPENIGMYLMKKKRLLELAKKGNKKAVKQMEYEDLKRLQQLLTQQVKESYGTEARFVDFEEDGGDEGEQKGIAGWNKMGKGNVNTMKIEGN